MGPRSWVRVHGPPRAAGGAERAGPRRLLRPPRPVPVLLLPLFLPPCLSPCLSPSPAPAAVAGSAAVPPLSRCRAVVLPCSSRCRVRRRASRRAAAGLRRPPVRWRPPGPPPDRGGSFLRAGGGRHRWVRGGGCLVDEYRRRPGSRCRRSRRSGAVPLPSVPFRPADTPFRHTVPSLSAVAAGLRAAGTGAGQRADSGSRYGTDIAAGAPGGGAPPAPAPLSAATAGPPWPA
jgi:hypothetical protein